MNMKKISMKKMIMRKLLLFDACKNGDIKKFSFNIYICFYVKTGTHINIFMHFILENK